VLKEDAVTIDWVDWICGLKAGGGWDEVIAY
jgi:hypothetical protein